MTTYNIDEPGSSEINARTNITSTRFLPKDTSENKRDSYTMWFLLGTIEPAGRVLLPVRILQVIIKNVRILLFIIGCLLNNLTTYQPWFGYLIPRFLNKMNCCCDVYLRLNVMIGLVYNWLKR